MDLRRYVPGKASAAVCNLSSAVWPAVTKDSAIVSFDRALAAVTESMAFLKADYPGIGAALYVDHVFSQPYSQAAAAVTENLRLANVRSHPYLSNLGALTLGDGGEDTRVLRRSARSRCLPREPCPLPDRRSWSV